MLSSFSSFPKLKFPLHPVPVVWINPLLLTEEKKPSFPYRRRPLPPPFLDVVTGRVIPFFSRAPSLLSSFIEAELSRVIPRKKEPFSFPRSSRLTFDGSKRCFFSPFLSPPNSGSLFLPLLPFLRIITRSRSLLIRGAFPFLSSPSGLRLFFSP